MWSVWGCSWRQLNSSFFSECYCAFLVCCWLVWAESRHISVNKEMWPGRAGLLKADKEAAMGGGERWLQQIPRGSGSEGSWGQSTQKLDSLGFKAWRVVWCSEPQTWLRMPSKNWLQSSWGTSSLPQRNQGWCGWREELLLCWKAGG